MPKMTLIISDDAWRNMEEECNDKTMGACCAADVLIDAIEAKFGLHTVEIENRDIRYS